ncbi:hypothetical protein [Sphingosinicella sp. CPCC 101087]|uniref:hypothetical protein n=1 Tax=Sphingosinicella sp. CPCC 101087 TaxID=2497754 RepID=UPI00101BC9B1|nr:hypothetical protein [Sphingosinicella sp. CPCC 101087]
MDWQDGALMLAGVIGSGVAVIHGILTHRAVVKPFGAVSAGDKRIGAPIRRLAPLLLQFSTFNWFVGGLALIAAASWFGSEARMVTGLLVGSSYLFGAIANAWAIRALHPGWVLYSVATVLIGFGIT